MKKIRLFLIGFNEIGCLAGLIFFRLEFDSFLTNDFLYMTEDLSFWKYRYTGWSVGIVSQIFETDRYLITT